MPALVGGLIVAGAVGGFFATRSAQHTPSTGDLQAAAAATADTITARLDTDAQLLSTAAVAIGGDPTLPDAQLQAALRRVARPDRILGVARTTTNVAPAVVVVASGSRTPSIVGLDVAARSDGRLVLELARDRAGAGAIDMPGLDGQPAVLDALPLYGTLDNPSDITGRRAELRGFVVSLVPGSAIVGAPQTGAADVSVSVTAGSTVLTTFGRGAGHTPPSSAVALPVSVNGVEWTVQAWSTPAASAWPWFVLVIGLVLAAAATAIVASRERSITRAVAETEARNQELALVARTGPLLQQSLALGDLLPVFVVEIGDELGLDSMSISLMTESGELTRAFSLGMGVHAPPPGTGGSPPDSAVPGEFVTIPLQRVGRVAGVFQARAVTGLSTEQMETLQAVCALLAAAVGNVRLFQEEQDMVTRLRDVDKMKTSFIGSVSHELRTSVTAIQGFARLLEADPNLDPTRRADYLERIGRNAKSLGILIEDLLDFARFERSGLTAALRPIDLTELVPNVVEQMSSVLDGRTVSVDVEPGVVALADALAVERVLANLLSNAGKYTPPESLVEITLGSDDHHAVLCVTDHGPGIPPEEREKVFELFYRSDESARVTRGVGIGLSLTRQLVTHLNGTIAVEEAPGGGARFRVTIPLADGTSEPPAASEPEKPSAGS